MTEEALENKQVEDDTSTQPAPAEKTNDNPTLSEEPKTQDEDVINFKAELEKEKDRRIKAEKKIEKLKLSQKDSPDAHQEGNISEIISETVQKELNKFQVASQEANYDLRVDNVSTNDEEAELIKYHLENSVKLTGNVNIDVENAKFLANKSKILKNDQELREALRSKQARGAISESGHKQPTEEPTSLSAKEIAFLKKFGVDPKEVK